MDKTYIIQFFDMVEHRIFISRSGMPTQDLHNAKTFETKRDAENEIAKLRAAHPRIWGGDWWPMVADLDRVREDMESVERGAAGLFPRKDVA